MWWRRRVRAAQESARRARQVRVRVVAIGQRAAVEACARRWGRLVPNRLALEQLRSASYAFPQAAGCSGSGAAGERKGQATQT
eukprot:2088736-Heterocapsa_arctica.AAC.1